MKEAFSFDEACKARGITRRNVLHTAAVTSILTAASSTLVGCGGEGSNNRSNGPSDADVLNFALNLEYLEAEFYTFATNGQSIEQVGIGVSGTGTPGPTTGGAQVGFTDTRLRDVSEELGRDERAHVTVLRGALGGNAVAKPAINLAALGDMSDETTFLVLARAFEDTGVSAYAGAARLIQNKDYLEVAARILAAEALHSGNLRLQVAQKGIATAALDVKDVPPPPTGTRYFTVDDQGLAVIRSTREVLNIVYGGPGASGAFFPNGFNGAIRA